MSRTDTPKRRRGRPPKARPAEETKPAGDVAPRVLEITGKKVSGIYDAGDIVTSDEVGEEIANVLIEKGLAVVRGTSRCDYDDAVKGEDEA